jgi:hypothetical protein
VTEFYNGQKVIVHTRDARERDNGDWPGVIVNVARKFVTIKWKLDRYDHVDKFRMEERHTGDFRGPNYGPWFETPEEMELRIATDKATEFLKAHGFELAPYHKPTSAKILGVAKFLADTYPHFRAH